MPKHRPKMSQADAPSNELRTCSRAPTSRGGPSAPRTMDLPSTKRYAGSATGGSRTTAHTGQKKSSPFHSARTCTAPLSKRVLKPSQPRHGPPVHPFAQPPRREAWPLWFCEEPEAWEKRDGSQAGEGLPSPWSSSHFRGSQEPLCKVAPGGRSNTIGGFNGSYFSVHVDALINTVSWVDREP